jgi:hypothetical protein
MAGWRSVPRHRAHISHVTGTAMAGSGKRRLRGQRCDRTGAQQHSPSADAQLFPVL